MNHAKPGALPSAQLRAQLYDQLRAQLDRQLYDQLDRQLDDQLYDQLREKT